MDDIHGLWRRLLETFDRWLDEDSEGREEASEDPSLMFHLMLTAPLVIGILVMVRRTLA
jgi:hypothetical protein